MRTLPFSKIIFITILSLILSIFAAKAQKLGEAKADSLVNALKNAGDNNKLKIDLYTQIAMEYYYINPRIGVDYATLGLDLAEQSSDEQRKAKIYNALGLCYFQNNQSSEALDCYYKALQINEDIQDRRAIGESYSNIGVVYSAFMNHQEAEDYFLKSINLLEEYKDTLHLIKTYGNLGNVYLNTKQYDKAFNNCISKAYDLAVKINDEMLISLSYLNYGAYYRYKKDYSKAFEYYEKSFSINVKNNCKILVLKNYLNFADYYLTVIDAYAKEPKNLQNVKIQKKYTALLFQNIQNGIQLAQELGTNRYLYAFYNYFSAYYKLKKDYKNAFKCIELYENNSYLADNNETKVRIMQLTTKRAREMNDREILKLQQTAEINQIRSKFYIVIIVLASLLVLILFYFFIRKRKDNERLQKVNSILIEKDRQLIEINSTKDKLFSIISHDLKSPIAALYQLVTGTVQESNKESDLQIKKSIIKSTANVMTLLENLLSWSRLQLNGFKLYFEEFNIFELASESINICAHIASNKNIEIDNLIDNEILVTADREAFALTLRNVIINAIKYSQTNSKIELLSQIDESTISVIVKDYGVGFSQNAKEQVFVFQDKIITAGTQNEKGSGLGLVIAKDIMKKHYGDLILDDNPEGGAIVKLVFSTKNDEEDD